MLSSLYDLKVSTRSLLFLQNNTKRVWFG